MQALGVNPRQSAHPEYPGHKGDPVLAVISRHYRSVVSLPPLAPALPAGLRIVHAVAHVGSTGRSPSACVQSKVSAAIHPGLGQHPPSGGHKGAMGISGQAHRASGSTRTGIRREPKHPAAIRTSGALGPSRYSILAAPAPAVKARRGA